MNNNDREAFIREQKEKSAPPAPPEVSEDLKFTHAQLEAFQREAIRISQENEGTGILQPARLNALQQQGYAFNDVVGAKMIRDSAADVAAYLSSDRGQADRCALQNVIHSKAQSLREYERIKAVVRRNQLYAKPVFKRDDNAMTDEYIVQRRRDLMHGIRRPR